MTIRFTFCFTLARSTRLPKSLSQDISPLFDRLASVKDVNLFLGCIVQALLMSQIQGTKCDRNSRN